MELIDKKPLIRHLVDWQMEQFAEVGHEREFNLLDLIIKGIENEPTVEAKEVVNAEWIHLGGDEWCCTECGYVISTEGSWEKPKAKFCEECGADMRTSAE